MATKRVQINTGGARRVTLDAARQKVADAEQALQSAQAEQEDVLNQQDGDPSGDTHIHIHTAGANSDATTDDEEGDPAAGGGDINARITAIEQSITQLTETVAKLQGGGTSAEAEPAADDAAGDGSDDESGDEDFTGDDGNPFPKKDDEEEAAPSGKTKDSAALETGYLALLAKAEVLVPGFRVPTFDSKAKRQATIDSMCALRRKVIDSAYMTRDGAALINGITGRPALNLAKMGCADVATLFNAAAGAKAAINNAQATRDTAAKVPEAKHNPTIAEINKANAEFWARQQAVR